MNHEENAKVHLSKESLASHTFITGSTGSGKSNTVYQLLNEAMEQGARFMVVEPAKESISIYLVLIRTLLCSEPIRRLSDAAN